jgi:hypothetical protein
MDSIVAKYGVCKVAICLPIKWVEDTLVKDGAFAMPGKKALKRKSASIIYVLVDVTESPINRPKRIKKSIIQEKNGTL